MEIVQKSIEAGAAEFFGDQNPMGISNDELSIFGHEWASHRYKHTEHVTALIDEYVPPYMFSMYRDGNNLESPSVRKANLVNHAVSQLIDLDFLIKSQIDNSLSQKMRELSEEADDKDHFFENLYELGSLLNGRSQFGGEWGEILPVSGKHTADVVMKFVDTLSDDEVVPAATLIKRALLAPLPVDLGVHGRGQSYFSMILLKKYRSSFSQRVSELTGYPVMPKNPVANISSPDRNLQFMQELYRQNYKMGTSALGRDFSSHNVLTNPEHALEILGEVGVNGSNFTERYDKKIKKSKIYTAAKNLLIGTLVDSAQSGSSNGDKLLSVIKRPGEALPLTEIIKLTNALDLKDDDGTSLDKLPVELTSLPEASRRLVRIADFQLPQEREDVENRVVASELIAALYTIATQNRDQATDNAQTERQVNPQLERIKQNASTRGRKRISWRAFKAGYGVVS